MVATSGHEAHLNGDQVTTYDQGMCQKFVRGPCWEVGSLYGSAIEAWNGSTQKHPGDRNPPEGAPVYYSGGQYGHAVIGQGGGPRIRSTDAPSAGKVSDQDLDWPERQWGYKYLGWTGDINGVDLPLGSDGEEDEVTNDDIEKIADAVWQRLIKNQSDAPDGRNAGPTLAGIYNHTLDVDEQVWDKMILNQDDAPDGRKAGPTLAGIYNKVSKILNAVT